MSKRPSLVVRDAAKEKNRWCRYVTETYSNPEQFDTPEDYLKALTEGLDALTCAVGRIPPPVHDVWSHRG